MIFFSKLIVISSKWPRDQLSNDLGDLLANRNLPVDAAVTKCKKLPMKINEDIQSSKDDLERLPRSSTKKRDVTGVKESKKYDPVEHERAVKDALKRCKAGKQKQPKIVLR